MSINKLSLPVDLGTGLEVTPKNLELYYNHTEQESSGGFFPFTLDRDWHSGLHLHPPENTTVHACADGFIIAARLEKAAGKLYFQNGCTNFILIRHPVPEIPNEYWYSCYFHLSHQVMETPKESLRTIQWIQKMGLEAFQKPGIHKVADIPVKAGEAIHFSGFRRDEHKKPAVNALHWETLSEKKLFQDMKYIQDSSRYRKKNMRKVLEEIDPTTKIPWTDKQFIRFYQKSETAKQLRDYAYLFLHEAVIQNRGGYYFMEDYLDMEPDIFLRRAYWWWAEAARVGGPMPRTWLWHYNPITFLKRFSRRARFQSVKAVILYPSFCSPAVLSNGLNGRYELTIFLAANDDFLKEAERQESGLNEIIAESIRLYPWGQSKEQTVNQRLTFPYESVPEGYKNITYTKVPEKEAKEGVIRYEKWNRTQFSAILRPSTMKLYREQGLKHLYQVELKNLKLEEERYKGATLFNLAWINVDQSPQQRITQKALKQRNSRYEKQDLLIRGLDKEGEPIDPNHLGLRGIREKVSRCFDVNKITRDLFEQEPNKPVESLHPVYICKKDRLNIGHLTDPHLSSRQHFFRKSRASVIPKLKDESKRKELGLVDLGKLVNASTETFWNLLCQFGRDREIDIVVITGDLIEFTRNLDMENLDTILKEMAKDPENISPMEMWRICDIKGIQKKGTEADGNYRPGIDLLTVFSLFREYYDRFKKPIFLISGNHEAYRVPYGLAPIAGVGEVPGLGKPLKDSPVDAKMARANEVVPADHNLTIYEANLLYGPTSDRIEIGFNYDPDQLGWFYTLFTPLQDFGFRFGAQSLTFLDWGSSEDILFDGQGFGHLPRTDHGVTDQQLELIMAMSTGKKYRGNFLLFSHFSIACHHWSRPLHEEGKIGRYSHGDYDLGTFETNRKEVYQRVVEKFYYTFSGHTHRCGLYKLIPEIEKRKLERDSEELTVYRSHGIHPNQLIKNSPAKGPDRALFREKPKPNRNHYYNESPKGPPPMRIPVNDKARFEPLELRVLVSDSSGSIPQQNWNGEFGNWGFTKPSGTWVKFAPQGNDTIGLYKATNKTAAPRLALACEYCDVVGRKHGGMFEYIRCFDEEMDRYGNYLFRIRFSKQTNLPTNDLFEKAVIYQFNGKEFVHYELNIEFNRETKDAILPLLQVILYKTAFYKNSRMFLQFHFKQNLKQWPELEDYNCSAEAAWIFPIKLFEPSKEEEIEFGTKEEWVQRQINPKRLHWEIERDWSLPFQQPDLQFYQQFW